MSVCDRGESHYQHDVVSCAQAAFLSVSNFPSVCGFAPVEGVQVGRVGAVEVLKENISQNNLLFICPVTYFSF